jgi:hypothetical protein
MKTSHWPAISAALTSICIFVPISGAQTTTGIPLRPAGELSAFPTIVQTGTKPTLTWSILYPSTISTTGTTGNGNGNGGGGSGGVSSVVTVNPPGTLIPNQTLYVTVQPVGTGVTACDPTQGPTPLPTDARVSINGSAYDQIFYGVQTNVDPAKKLFIKKVFANQLIDFGGRYVTKNGTWSPFYTTRSANMQVVSLVNGATPPTYFSLYSYSQLATYLKPYLDASGKVKIGPMSVLVLMELGQTNRSSQCFDYQDQVLLVTFSVKHPNNGHGNNLDGVDSSNPGNGSGGPNGQVDPSGGIDDEIR